MTTNQNSLSHKKCTPCTSGTNALKGNDLAPYMKQLNNDWKLVEEHHIEKEYKFPDFRKALAFTNKIGEIAEREDHHPDIYLSWGKVKVKLWTHKINGLSENDFILAAKCDEALKSFNIDSACF